MARDQDEYYLTVAEVAELLRLNQQTVRNWIDQGSLPALRVGRRVRIRRSDFDRLLTEGYSGGSRSGVDDAGPSAEDFWGGEPVGVAEVAAGAALSDAALMAESGTSEADMARGNTLADDGDALAGGGDALAGGGDALADDADPDGTRVVDDGSDDG